jgi:hypothetical protein
LLSWLGDRVFGARHHLESVFVAVLLVPVVPDLFVDWMGNPAKPERNGLLRVAAVLSVFLVAIIVGAARNSWARRRGARSRRPFVTLPAADVLVLPLSARPGPYLRRKRRQGPPEILEFLCDGISPKTVLCVVTSRTAALVDDLTVELAADGIDLRVVSVDNAANPVTAIEECDGVLEQLRLLEVARDRVVVDVTGGNVPLTLAMMRVSALVGARCVYVSSEVDSDGRRVPYTQRGHAFEPRALTEGW